MADTARQIVKAKDNRGLTRLTKAKKRKFAQHLRDTGNVSECCRLIGISKQTAYHHKRKDPVFAQLWDDAKEAVLDNLEQALYKRGFEGVERTVRYKGEEVGVERHFSDTAAIFLLKGNREKYRESGSVSVQLNDNRTQIAGMSDAQLERVLTNTNEFKKLEQNADDDSVIDAKLIDNKEE